MYISLLSLIPLASAIALPPPIGPHKLTLNVSQLIDTSRPDPWGKDVIPYRRIMISRFDPLPLNTPCSVTEDVDYMTPTLATATQDLFAGVSIPINLFTNLTTTFCTPPSYKTKPFPLVLFSPGYSAPRGSYNLLAAELASHGFTVLTLDHPFDGTVEFPDGTIAQGANTNFSDPLSILKTLDIRVKDVSFVLDTLNLSPDTPVLGVGHSFGGATMAQNMHDDLRIRGAVNLDGGLFGSVVEEGFPPSPSPSPSPFNQSFVLFGATGHNTTTDASWGLFHDKLASQGIWQRELFLEKARHGTFSDLPFLVDFQGTRRNLTSAALAFLGEVEGTRTLEVLGRFLGDYFGFVLGGGEGVLSGPSGEFPEVEFLG